MTAVPMGLASNRMRRRVTFHPRTTVSDSMGGAHPTVSSTPTGGKWRCAIFSKGGVVQRADFGDVVMYTHTMIAKPHYDVQERDVIIDDPRYSDDQFQVVFVWRIRRELQNVYTVRLALQRLDFRVTRKGQ